MSCEITKTRFSKCMFFLCHALEWCPFCYLLISLECPPTPFRPDSGSGLYVFLTYSRVWLTLPCDRGMAMGVLWWVVWWDRGCKYGHSIQWVHRQQFRYGILRRSKVSYFLEYSAKLLAKYIQSRIDKKFNINLRRNSEPEGPGCPSTTSQVRDIEKKQSILFSRIQRKAVSKIYTISNRQNV